MTAPIVEQIVDNVLTALNNITVANGYHQTIMRAIRFYGEMAEYETPMVDVMVQGETNLDEELDGSYGITTRDLRLIVRAYVGDTLDPDEALSYLGADVDKALHVDVHRGALAQNTYVESLNRLFVDANADDMAVTGVMDITVVIRYQQKLLDPYSSR